MSTGPSRHQQEAQLPLSLHASALRSVTDADAARRVHQSTRDVEMRDSDVDDDEERSPVVRRRLAPTTPEISEPAPPSQSDSGDSNRDGHLGMDIDHITPESLPSSEQLSEAARQDSPVPAPAPEQPRSPDMSQVPDADPSDIENRRRTNSLRSEIISIQGRKDLTPEQRARAIQDLMSGGQKRRQSAGSGGPPPSVLSAKLARSPSYQDDAKEVLGCKHYARSVKLRCDECHGFYVCRFCHDEFDLEHKLDRYKVKEMLCMKCGLVQDVGRECKGCHSSPHYYCDTCHLVDDTTSKDIYHCPHCNLCRIGKGLEIDYFHCSTCNACIPISMREHKCVERSLESNCPICHDDLFTSTAPVIFMKCGHPIHHECYKILIETEWTCPVCQKSLGDMKWYFQFLDHTLSQETMPEEYRHQTTSILCRDCEVRSDNVPLHFLYHKCPECGGYNTTRV